jgi:hypothetical protein
MPVLLGSALLALASLSAGAGEMKVTLFGQPCMLKGPVDDSVLKAIHAISPEQAIPDFTLEESKFKAALEAVNKASGLPSALDHYKEKLTLRLQAEEGFLEGLQAAKKSGSMEQLLAVTKKFRQAKPSRVFEKAARAFPVKDLAKNSGSTITDSLQELFDSYSDCIEQDPEEEFHRAIRLIKVQYACTFEENEEGDSE